MHLLHRLRAPKQAAALLATLMGAIIPWVRLAIRGHVEFCDGECNPRDWLDYADIMGGLLSLCIPAAVLTWLAFQFFRRDERNWMLMLVWLFTFIGAIASGVYLARLEEAYFAQF
ncbi:hypothetical protein [Comamonas sp. 4034]|uniref:hypothetical protein n=1 Tax=Comamonas sp. 4034 TaxID=3156455 RepID=UPI003D1DA798